MSLLSRIPPTVYLITYIFLVPIFAFLYTRLDGSFYAPYAKLETAAEADKVEVQNTLFEALKGNTSVSKVFDFHVLAVSNVREASIGTLSFVIDAGGEKNGKYVTAIMSVDTTLLESNGGQKLAGQPGFSMHCAALDGSKSRNVGAPESKIAEYLSDVFAPQLSSETNPSTLR